MTMPQQTFSSVWDALEDTPQAAENMALRSELMAALIGHIHHLGLDEEQAARMLEVTRPRVADLLHGKIDRFGLDDLIRLSTAAGLSVRLVVEPA